MEKLLPQSNALWFQNVLEVAGLTLQTVKCTFCLLSLPPQEEASNKL